MAARPRGLRSWRLASLLLLLSAPRLARGVSAPQGRPVALVFELDATYVAALSGAGPAVELIECRGPDFCGSLGDDVCSRAVAVVGQPRDISMLSRPCFSNLRLLQGSSYMHTQFSDVPPHITIATYQPDWEHVYGVEPIAEFVLAATFQWNYRLREAATAFAACAWGSDAPQGCPSVSELTTHPTLMGQTMGVLGYGKIGQAVARRAAALGMRAVATRRHGPFEPPPPPLTWLGDDNDKLLREADFVAVTVPGSVVGIINETALRLMKPSAVLLPVSANPVDYGALYEALSKHQIGGAVIDVWPHGCWHFPDMACGPPYGPPAEPYADRPIHSLPNVLPLPGVAMRDAKFWAGSADWVVQNLRALTLGKPLRGVVRNGTRDEAMWL